MIRSASRSGEEATDTEGASIRTIFNEVRTRVQVCEEEAKRRDESCGRSLVLFALGLCCLDLLGVAVVFKDRYEDKSD